ncbi:hypothetical protein EQO05_12050 [Methanosarcina sp. MSH10X1]|uniref:COG1470 family protein n=1 Tax=Methanosarcina sp. MSH10X1 TaxID=2507075 RepID=UPI000FFC2203|nr:hypothetical protein [Methanosarcina sp. MSH10X1]RXA17616.1 hypothetical protein EQO05_12050 [Methanosarcina sp. MSH10X1]
MNKSIALKAVSQFLSILICLVLIPAAFAQPEELSGSIIYEDEIPEAGLDNGNYTVHLIDPTYYSAFLLPGESETFDVSFRNEGSEILNIAPKVVAVPYGYDNVNESWITISPANTTVSPGKEQDFAIEVTVPADAESGEYQAQIAFTDDIYPVYDDPVYDQEYTDAQYVNTMYLGISVPVRPKLELQADYISDIIEPGREYVYAIKIKNVAEKDINIDPEVISPDLYDYSADEPAFSNDAIEITAPSTIKAGEITNMTILVPVPENASGSYNGFIEFNADGEEYDGSVPEISLSFAVNKQPYAPYVKTFNTSTTDPIKIEVSTVTNDPDVSRILPQKEMPAFEMNLKCNSSPVNLTLVKTIESGTVYSTGYNFPIWIVEDSSYNSYSRQYLETYKASGAIGAWELTILPKNTNNFDYSITVEDSEKKLK